MDRLPTPPAPLRRPRAWLPALLLTALLALPGGLHAQAGGGDVAGEAMVFPGESWVSLHGDEAALEALGWSPEGLERAWTFVRDSARTTGLVVVDRGRVVLEFGDIDDLSYVASVRRTKWLDSGMLLMRRATS